MKAPSIKKNFMMNAILSVSSIIFPLITYPYVTRILGPDGIGKVGMAQSVINYFTLAAQLGVPIYGIRECAKRRDDKEALSRLAYELLILSLITTVISYAVYYLCITCVPKLAGEKNLYMLMGVSILCSIISMEWLYKGLEQYTYITVRSLIFNTTALILIFLLVNKTDDYVIYGGLIVLAPCASGLVNFIHSRKLLTRPRSGLRPFSHIKTVLVFFAMSCATTIYTNLDTVMLGAMRDDAEVGYYRTAVYVKIALVSVITSLGAVMLPRASYYIEHNEKEKFKEATGKAINFVLTVAIPLMVYFIIFAKETISIISGAKFTASIAPMQLIMPTLLFIGLSNIIGFQILVPLGKEKYVLISEIAGAVTDFIINLALIPRYGAAGAAIGTTIAELVVTTVQMIAAKGQLVSIIKMKNLISPMLGTVAGYIATIMIRRLTLTDAITMLISAVAFFGIYMSFNYSKIIMWSDKRQK